MLAHELRNPLAPDPERPAPAPPGGRRAPTAEQAREIAERQVRHLARLVDDLLDVSRISSGKIQLRKGRVELREVVARAVETARPLIEARRHELSVSLPDEPDPAGGRRGPAGAGPRQPAEQRRQVHRAGRAASRSKPVARGTSALVRVRDNGIGIAPELLPRVFDLFTQADRSLDRSQGGLGIGLTLVRRLVELHGGSVTASSAGVGQGSEFVVRLPVGSRGIARRRGGTLRARPSRPGRVQPRPKRVLVVDDNVDGARILARLLQASGHQTQRGTRRPLRPGGGAGAHLPDVVLLDIGLPGMDGYQVAERLREMEGMERRPARGLDRLWPGCGPPPLPGSRDRPPPGQAGRSRDAHSAPRRCSTPRRTGDEDVIIGGRPTCAAGNPSCARDNMPTDTNKPPSAGWWSSRVKDAA